MLQQTLAQGLQGLLDYDGDVSEAFMQPFSIAVVDVFGVPQVHNLKENGDEIIVTNETTQVASSLHGSVCLCQYVRCMHCAVNTVCIHDRQCHKYTHASAVSHQ